MRRKVANPNIEAIDHLRKNQNFKGYERWRAIGKQVVTDFKLRGHLFNTQQGLFFFDKETCRTAELSKDGLAIAAILNHRHGLNPKEHGYGRVLADLMSDAYVNGKTVDFRRLAHYDKHNGRLYVSSFDGHIYRLDGDSIIMVPNGTDDVFFFDEESLTEPYLRLRSAIPGEFDKQLIHSVNFSDSTLTEKEQRLLLKLWVMAVFFGSIQPTKIILLLLGEHGSGKTSALRRIQKFIFGQRAELLSIEKQDGFVATVTTDPLALFDNLDERIHWLPYALSRLATGVAFPKRVLYTTNQKAQFPGISWLGITARSVDFMAGQPDLPDRTLVLELERLNQKRPEGDLIAEIAKHRNAMWSELLTELNAVVKHLRQNPEPIQVRFRMADFAAFCLRVAEVWGCRAEVEARMAMHISDYEKRVIKGAETRRLALILTLSALLLFGRPSWEWMNQQGWLSHDKLARVSSDGWAVSEYKECTSSNQEMDEPYLDCASASATESARVFKVAFHGPTYTEEQPAQNKLTWNCRKNQMGDPEDAAFTCWRKP